MIVDTAASLPTKVQRFYRLAVNWGLNLEETTVAPNEGELYRRTFKLYRHDDPLRSERSEVWLYYTETGRRGGRLATYRYDPLGFRSGRARRASYRVSCREASSAAVSWAAPRYHATRREPVEV